MSNISVAIFSGMQVLLDKQWVQNLGIVIENQQIKAIIPKDMIAHHLPAKRYEFDATCYLIPGLIDLHIHGTHGKDVMDANIDALHTISRALATEGVTGFLATTMSAEHEKIESVLKTVSEAIPLEQGAAILGVHLEGPFLAAAKMGAQSPAHLEVPDILLIQRWQTIANDAIKLVTLAPELPNALDFIRALRKMDVVASIGHTNATYEETSAAINAGCTYATHLFNAMSGLHHREPGSVGAILLSQRVVAEIIVDGLHLHPVIVEMIFKMKGKDGLVLVTDAMRAKCLSDGEYELGGQQVQVVGNKAILRNGTLAGSTLHLAAAIKNMVQFSKCTLAEAIHMATYTPAKVLGLLNRKGSIAVGKDADLVILNADLDVQMTMRDGRELFRK